MQSVSLGEIVEIRGGGTPDKKVPEYWGGEIPWASVKDFKSAELGATVDSITDAGVAKSATQVIPAGNIIVPTRMAVGKAAINTIDLAINQDLKALIPSNKVDRQYLLHALLANSRTLEDQATGATVKGIKLNALRDLQIPLPPLEEQKRIAGILDQADSLRRLRTRALDKLNTLGQAIFHEMFGRANEHKTRKLSEIAELINGDRSSNYPSGDEVKTEGVLFLSTKNIRDWRLELNRSQFITQQKFDSLSRGKLQRGDIVITLRGTLGQAAIFDCELNTGFINAQMMIIRPKAGISAQYLLDFLALDSTQHELNKGQSGSAVKQLTAKQVGDLPVVVPDKAQQSNYAQRISTHHAFRQRNLKHMEVLETLFSSLQHRAFRGEL